MRILPAFAIAVLSLHAHASAQTVTTAALSIGFSRPPSDKPSMSLSVMVGKDHGWLGVQAWGDLLMSENTESVYYQDGSVCRNGDTGEFASAGNCGPAMDGAVRGEIAVHVPRSGLSFGPGFRLATDRSQPYGYMEYRTDSPSGSFFLVRGLGGQSLVQLEVGVGFAWGRKDP